MGNEEIRLETGTSFIVPLGVPHSIKKEKDENKVMVFWFHSKV